MQRSKRLWSGLVGHELVDDSRWLGTDAAKTELLALQTWSLRRSVCGAPGNLQTQISLGEFPPHGMSYMMARTVYST